MTNAANDENMMKIKHTPITDEYFTASPSTPLREIAKKLAEGENVAAAIVVENEIPKGIIVKDDVLNRGVLANLGVLFIYDLVDVTNSERELSRDTRLHS